MIATGAQRWETVDGRGERHALGGKAANLIALREAGFRVPPFLCSPQHLDEGLQVGTVPPKFINRLWLLL